MLNVRQACHHYVQSYIYDSVLITLYILYSLIFALSATSSSVFGKYYKFVLEKINVEDAALVLLPKQTGSLFHCHVNICGQSATRIISTCTAEVS